MPNEENNSFIFDSFHDEFVLVESKKLDLRSICLK